MRTQIQQRCEQQLSLSAAAALNGTIALCWGGERLAFELWQGQFQWLDSQAATQATFYFASADDVEQLLYLNADPYNELLAQFMDGRVRSSGYLLWTFTLLTLFRGSGQ